MDSIAYLIIVTYLKNTVSMEDIRFLLGVQQDSYQLSVAYDYFCEELEDLLRYVIGIQETPSVIDHMHPQKELLRTALFSVTYKIYLAYRIALLRQEEQSEAPSHT